MNSLISAFLSGSPHAVVGASRDRSKYGNKVLRAYQQAGRLVFPVNPAADVIEGHPAYPALDSLPEDVHGVSIITPPATTQLILEDVVRLGIGHVWLQPGAEDARVLARADELGLQVIAGGPCLLVVLGYRE